MAISAPKQQALSFDDYLLLEVSSEIRHELVDGERRV